MTFIVILTPSLSRGKDLGEDGNILDKRLIKNKFYERF
jgi:hypothetical protein